jgi:hypothetical protein
MRYSGCVPVIGSALHAMQGRPLAGDSHSQLASEVHNMYVVGFVHCSSPSCVGFATVNRTATIPASAGVSRATLGATA